MKDLNGYIAAKYNGYWWLGCVIQTFAQQNEVEMNFLHPHGPAQSFHYPRPDDPLKITALDDADTGCAYNSTSI